MRLPLRAVTVAGLGFGLLACDLDPLSDPDRPVITPESAANAAGAQAFRAAAISDMTQFTGGGVNAWVSVGLLTDELINTRVAAGVAYGSVDQRIIDPNFAPTTQTWLAFSQVLYSAPRAQRAMRQYVPASPTRAAQLGQLHAFHGLALTIGGEIYCNGIPFSYLHDDGTITYDPKAYSNIEVWERALVQFDSALAVIPAGDAGRSLARVGKARALLNLNRASEAAAVVRAGGDGTGSPAVPTSYVFNTEYAASGTTPGPNGPWNWTLGNFNFSVPNGAESPSSLDWRDPRVEPKFYRKGQDGVTDVYVPSATPWTLTSSSAYPIANGTEARLIEAEALLRAGDPGWLTTLNQLRASPPAPWPASLAAKLPALADPGTTAARENLLFKERAMWLFLTGHRLGDLRRLVRQYGRAPDSVFPSGAYFRGGSYGGDVNFQPWQREVDTNPYWKGCTDRQP